MTYYKSLAEIADAYGVSRQAVSKWRDSDTFPRKAIRGWPKDGVVAWVSAKNERVQKKAELTGDREEKTRLECERLRVVIDREKETLKQAQIETKRQSHKLVERAEVDREASRVGSMIRGRIDAFRQHQTAKHPNLKADIDRFCDDMMEDIRLALVS